MNSTSMIREASALRHNFQVNRRLQLEFLAGLSKLLRDYGVRASDDLLSRVTLAVPDEMVTNGHHAAGGKTPGKGGGGKKGRKEPGPGPQPPGGGKKEGGKKGGRKPGPGPQPAPGGGKKRASKRGK